MFIMLKLVMLNTKYIRADDTIFIYCNWICTQWQWFLHLYTKVKNSNTHKKEKSNILEDENNNVHKEKNTGIYTDTEQ